MLTNGCVIGSDHSLDTNRARLFLELILLKCSPLYPQSVVLKEYGPRALEALTCHILGVLVVSSSIRLEIQNAIKQVINALHEENAGTWEECSEDMAKIIVGYFQWIRSSSLQNIKDCRREEIIAAVNPSVRACLKDETYHSSAHLVQVYHLKYKTLLYNMPIPIQPYSIRDIKQAHKDILRENIRVNKVMYIGGKTQTPTGSLQSGKDLQLDGAYINKFDRKAVAEEWEEVDATEAIAEELKKVVVFLCGLPDGEMLQTSPSLLVRKSASRTLPGMQSISTSQKMRNWVQDMDLYDPPSSGSAAKPTVIIPPLPPASSLVQPSANTYRDFHRILLAYTLLAASRTYATGDAFMILNDLYGGEGLMFCPFHRWSASSSSGPSTPQRSRSMSTKSQTSESAMTDECDCQVAITTSGVKVKLREHYRLYATAEMNRCTNANQLPPPLACFECTTTTIILLNPSAVASSVGDTGREIQLDQLSFSQLFDLLISNPQRMVHRAVSIEPYI